MSSVLSFAEESCWDGESFRSIRRPIVFSVSAEIPYFRTDDGVAKHLVESTFVSDFGVFFDPEDDWLIIQLLDKYPHVEWGRLIYWKSPDHSRIDLVDPDTDEKVGVITPRGVQSRRRPGDILPEGVSCLTEWRRKLSVEGGRNDSAES